MIGTAERISLILARRYATPGGTGINVAVPITDSTITIALRLRELDTDYGVLVTPNWLTTFRVTSKTRDSFVIDFGTPAPADAALDYAVIRTEVPA